MTTSTEVEKLQKVFKIVPADIWKTSCESGFFVGSPDDKRDGYIHLSCACQLRETFNKNFRGQSGLLLVAFKKSSLAPQLRWETSRNGELFPHFYGLLPTRLAIAQRSLALNADGLAELDEDCL